MEQEKLDTVPAGQALEASRAGTAVIVDVRGSRQFDAGHPPGALNVPHSARGLSDRISDLLAAVYGIASPEIVLLGEDDETAGDALDQVNEATTLGGATAIAGGMIAWLDAELPTETVEEIDVTQLAPDARPERLVTLDVREPSEWEMGHVPGALLISLSELAERAEEVPIDRPVAVICEAGIRSSMAASMLRAKGYTDLLHAVAGTAAYRAAGLPMQYAEATE